MKLAQAARMLGINDRTLKLWIERPELAPHFSRPARLPAAQRDLNDDDLIVANTIRSMRAGVSNLEVDWQHMGERLAGGYRDQELPASAVTLDTRMPVLRQYERTVRLVAERDSAVQRAQELEAQLREQAARISELHGRLADDRERLLREAKAEQRQLEQELAAALAELKLWQAGKLRPD